MTKAIRSKKLEFTDSSWGPLRFPKEFISSPEGKMPLEIYIQKFKVAYKVKYVETKETITKSAPPKFILTTSVSDLGFIFENNFEIRGVGVKFWNGVSTPMSTEIIIKKVRPEVKIAPKLKEDKPKKTIIQS